MTALKHALSLSLLALALGVSSSAHAQKGPPPHAGPPLDGAGHKRAEAQAHMRQMRARLLRERVGLDEKTAQSVEKVLDKYQTEREKLRATVGQEKKTLRALLDLDGNDQAAYTRAMRSMLDAQQKLERLKQQEFDELSKILTPKQQAKLWRVITEAMKRMQDAMKHKRDRDDD